MTTEFGFALLAVVLLVIYLVSVWSLYSQNKRLEAEISGMVELRDSPLLLSARVEIDRLKKDNQRLRDVRDAFQRESRALEGELRRIGSPSKKITFCRDGHEESVLIARAALGAGK
jgi:cbb3-type cytochrome oxidase subunit 3